MVFSKVRGGELFVKGSKPHPFSLAGKPYLRCLRPRFADLYIINSEFVDGWSPVDSSHTMFYTQFDALSS